jgi:hypothetical protein
MSSFISGSGLPISGTKSSISFLYHKDYFIIDSSEPGKKQRA